MADSPVGTVVAYAGQLFDNGGVIEFPPGSGWLLCNGAAARSTQFPQLFAAIRAAHGDGSDSPHPATDFNLPDYRGLFLRGVSGERSDAYADPDTGDADRPENHPGGNVGNRVGSVQPDTLRSHRGDVNDPGHWHPSDVGNNHHAGSGAADHDFPNNPEPARTQTAVTNVTIQVNGGNEARPKNAYVHWLIKARP